MILENVKSHSGGAEKIKLKIHLCVLFYLHGPHYLLVSVWRYCTCKWAFTTILVHPREAPPPVGGSGWSVSALPFAQPTVSEH